ncbi:MAG: nicotinamide riboside transporter PnuC [Campylobacterota bacterium]
MDLTLKGIFDAFAMMSGWEVMAVILGISYVILAAKELQMAWPFAFFSTLIYTILFWEGALVSSSALNFYYMVMAVYGFMLWKEDEKGERLAISQWSAKRHVLTIIAGVSGGIVLGYVSETYMGAKFAYLDAFVMVFSMIATWMLAKKVLENWLYWMVIDSAAIILYWKSGYLATIILFALYIVLAFYGYASWRKALNEHKAQ